MNWPADPQIWVSLVTLITLRIVPGVNNLVFIAVLVEKPVENRRAGMAPAGGGTV